MPRNLNKTIASALIFCLCLGTAYDASAALAQTLKGGRRGAAVAGILAISALASSPKIASGALGLSRNPTLSQFSPPSATGAAALIQSEQAPARNDSNEAAIAAAAQVG